MDARTLSKTGVLTAQGSTSRNWIGPSPSISRKYAWVTREYHPEAHRIGADCASVMQIFMAMPRISNPRLVCNTSSRVDAQPSLDVAVAEVADVEVFHLCGLFGGQFGLFFAVDVLKRDFMPKTFCMSNEPSGRLWWDGLPLLIERHIALRATDGHSQDGLREAEAFPDAF